MISHSNDFNDAEYDLIEDLNSELTTVEETKEVPSAFSAGDKAYSKFLLAKDFMVQQAYPQALVVIQQAIDIYKNIPTKNLNDWKTLADLYEAEREIHEKQNQVLLDSNLRVLNMLKQTDEANKHLRQEVEEIKTDYLSFSTAINIAVAQLTQQNELYRSTNVNLNNEIQQLRSRTQPTLIEHIASEIKNTFNAIAHYNFRSSIRNSIFSFFTQRRNSADEPSSPTAKLHKII